MLVKVFFAAEAGDIEATKAMLEAKREEIAQLLPEHRERLPMLEGEQCFHAMTLDLGVRLYDTIASWIDDTIEQLNKLERS
jgi:hypothetical protein